MSDEVVHLNSFHTAGLIEAGCDEAGRGCLAGPVFAAAVILPLGFKSAMLRDSKSIKESDRYRLRDIIIKEAVSWSVAMKSVAVIDKINILNASIAAMQDAVSSLTIRPEHLIIDGNRFHPYEGIPHKCIVRGDDLYLSIAAASILAKTFRDDHMYELSRKFPQYGWAKNKGYGTQEHREALNAYGRTIHHRLSFVVKNQATLFD